jgi:hypothetical protein
MKVTHSSFNQYSRFLRIPVIFALMLGFLVVGMSGCARDKVGVTDGSGDDLTPDAPSNVAPPTNLWLGSMAYHKCYTPCSNGLEIEDENGESVYINCVEDLLSYCTVDGVVYSDAMTDITAESIECFCPDDAQCISGNCLRPAAVLPTCENDLECPYFQACINGECHSNCESDDECGEGLECRHFVCRLPCSMSESDQCGTGYACEPIDAENGFCAMVGQADGDTRHLLGTYTVEKTELSFNSVRMDRNFLLTNKTDTSLTFTIETQAELGFIVSHTQIDEELGYNDARSLTDTLVDSTAGDFLEFVVEPQTEVNINVINQNLTSDEAWKGVFLIDNAQLGSKQVRVSYKTRPEGQWSGKVYYFANFEDYKIDEWKESGYEVGVGGEIGNAFMRHWAKFSVGRKTYDDFMAMLTSTLTGSWDWPSVQKKCLEEYSNVDACYLNDNARGIERFITNIYSADIPTGGLELPITLNMRRVADDTADTPDETEYYGKIVSQLSMHYAGDPHLELTFENDPNNCATSVNEALCLQRITEANFEVHVGGRYTPEASDTDCIYGDESSFEKIMTPWLVPGFTYGTEEAKFKLYKTECRDKWLPGGNDAAKYESNVSFAAANPIPDGKVRKRTVELVDGIIINQDTIFIVFKETFESFLGSPSMGIEGGGDFSAYGIMHLTLRDVDLRLSDYDGTVFEDPRQQPEDLLGFSCSDEILNDIYPDLSTTDIDINELAQIVIIGNNQTGVQLENLLDEDATFGEMVHYLCEYPEAYYQNFNEDPEYGGSGQLHRDHFDSGPMIDSDSSTTYGPRSFCPAGSLITYFTLDNVDNDYVRDHGCQPVDGEEQTSTCRDALNAWLAGASSIEVVQEQAIWRCEEEDEVQCDLDRFDLRDGKLFYAAEQDEGNKVVYQSLRNEIDQAFRYKTQFVSRSGATIGFAPQECIENSGAIPYCYDPPAIEKIQDRINCALHIYTDSQYEGIIGSMGGSKLILKNYLEENFAGGFEFLNAELLIMMGDEAYTDAFASRFDLAMSGNMSFEGSLFEPDGINLSGGAGLEMHNLYQAVQYYTMALDRFYSLSPAVWKSISGDPGDNFIGQEMISMYVARLVRASAQKSRAWSEIAKRYQNFNQPDLARTVIQRAYTSTYLELIVLRRMLMEIKSILPLADQAQVEMISGQTVLLYKAALLDMRTVYSEITDGINYFGYSPDYIPLPALDSGDNNAFEKILASAKRKIAVARDAEYKALNDSRTYDVDEAEFQAELVSIRNTYENELGELCGTFQYPPEPIYEIGAQEILTADTEVEYTIYPAIPKYAYLDDRLKLLGNPCGMTPNGTIYEAITQIEIEMTELRLIIQKMNNVEQEIEIEQDRVRDMCSETVAEAAEFCSTTVDDANVAFDWCRGGIGLYVAGEAAKNVIDVGILAAEQVKVISEMSLDAGAELAEAMSCVIIAGVSCGTDCAGTVLTGSMKAQLKLIDLSIQVPANIIIGGLEKTKDIIDQATTIAEMTYECYAELGDVELTCDLTTADKKFECNYMKIDSEAKTKTLALSLIELSLDALKAQYRIQQAASAVQRLRNKADSMIAQQEEAEELSINIEAARNNPNVRIYKNDAIINADKYFYAALSEVYKATKVLEYYSSSSYEPLFTLFLIRMVTAGLYNLDNFLYDLEDAYWDFQEEYGNPDVRVAVLSLKDDILEIPRINIDGRPLSEMERIEKLRAQLSDVTNLDDNGYFSIIFRTSFSDLSPLTRNHKILYIEAEIAGSDTGDDIGRIYLSQTGTGVVKRIDGEKSYYAFAERTAVIDTFFNGSRAGAFSTDEIYRSERLRDRPLLNTGWNLRLNQVDERVNQDINLDSVNDIRLYVYYTDFTVF